MVKTAEARRAVREQEEQGIHRMMEENNTTQRSRTDSQAAARTSPRNSGSFRSTIKYAFISSLPVMAGYIVLGTGFGVLLQDKGYNWLWAALMSVTIFAGSMQYVAVDLLSGGATLIAAALMTVLVNIRHLFYGLTMLEKYSDTGWRKPYLIFALTDETFSLVCSPDLPGDVDRKNYYFFLSLMNQCYWITGSIIGAVAGAALSFNSAGIDFAMTALFVVIFVEQWEKTKQHLPAIIGVAVTVVCRLLFGTSSFLIPSMIGILAAMFLFKGKVDSGSAESTADIRGAADEAFSQDGAETPFPRTNTQYRYGSEEYSDRNKTAKGGDEQ